MGRLTDSNGADHLLLYLVLREDKPFSLSSHFGSMMIKVWQVPLSITGMPPPPQPLIVAAGGRLTCVDCDSQPDLQLTSHLRRLEVEACRIPGCVEMSP